MSYDGKSDNKSLSTYELKLVLSQRAIGYFSGLNKRLTSRIMNNDAVVYSGRKKYGQYHQNTRSY